MAIVNRFINTASTAGGDGTTNATAGANRAYATSAEWEAAEQTDLPAAGDIHFVRGAGAQDTGARLIIAGWVTDATNYIIFSAIDDKPADGVFDAAKYFLDIDTEGNPIMEVQEEFVRIEDVQFRRASLASSGLDRECIFFPAVLGAGDIRIERSIFKSIASDIAGMVSGVTVGDSSPTYTICDNIFYDFNGTVDEAIGGGASSPSVLIYNNTIINCLTGIVSKSSMLIKNNIFQDCTTDISGAVNGSNDYNLTDNVSMPGANSVTSSVLTFENKASDNFDLVVGDTDAIGAGIGPSADANVPLSDIIGTARSGATTDIGAFVFVGGGGVTVTATEILNSFADSSVIDIDFNVSLSVTEVLSTFTDTSTLSITSGNAVLANITETLNAFSDSSTVNVSANISATVTEVLNSFLDGSNVTIAKDITIQVTEVFASFTDNSTIKLPANWVDKPAVITSYTIQTPVTTIWTDKG